MFWVEMRQTVPFSVQMHPDIVTATAMLLTTDSAKQPTEDPRAGFAPTKHLLKAERLNPKSTVLCNLPVLCHGQSYTLLHLCLEPVKNSGPSSQPSTWLELLACTFRDVWEALLHVCPSSGAGPRAELATATQAQTQPREENPGKKHRKRETNLGAAGAGWAFTCPGAWGSGEVSPRWSTAGSSPIAQTRHCRGHGAMPALLTMAQPCCFGGCKTLQSVRRSPGTGGERSCVLWPCGRGCAAGGSRAGHQQVSTRF